jgi:UDP-N-acetylmuramyl tripeptide synthase
MQILSVQPLRGPNLWSISTHLLIQVKIDFTAEDKLSIEALNKLFASANASCPFLNSNAHTSAAQYLIFATTQMAIYLQSQAGFDVSYTAYKSTINKNIYNIVYEYQNEDIGIAAIDYAVDLVKLILNSEDVTFQLQNYIQDLKSKYTLHNVDLQKLTEACELANIPYILPDEDLPLHIGYGIYGKDISPAAYQSTLKELLILFKDKTKAFIPIIAITGSNGKTTTTRLIAHILQVASYQVGFTTSDGIYVQGEMIDKGDTTGPFSAKMVLRNPKVEVAVLETARGGIVRAGLGFKQCDLAIVTNVQNDHLGISDIETMEALAKVKEVIVQAVKSGGTAILNADNFYTLQMGLDAKCKVAWFTTDVKNPALNNLQDDYLYVEGEKVYYKKGREAIYMMDVNDIPITFNGTLGFMTQNALAAILACLQFGIDPEIIVKGVTSFYPGEAQTPGRMNIYQFKQCQVMVDFAHNPEGFTGIAAFLKSNHANYKIGIIVGTGDRKDEDVKLLGKISATMFDHVLIHQVKFLRGQTANRLVSLLVDGMKEENPNISWERVPDEAEPLLFALQMINTEDSMIVALSDVLNEPAVLVKKYQEVF